MPILSANIWIHSTKHIHRQCQQKCEIQICLKYKYKYKYKYKKSLFNFVFKRKQSGNNWKSFSSHQFFCLVWPELKVGQFLLPPSEKVLTLSPETISYFFSKLTHPSSVAVPQPYSVAIFRFDHRNSLTERELKILLSNVPLCRQWKGSIKRLERKFSRTVTGIFYFFPLFIFDSKGKEHRYVLYMI